MQLIEFIVFFDELTLNYLGTTLKSVYHQILFLHNATFLHENRM